MTYIQGIPTPSPRIKPVATAFPKVCNIKLGSKYPVITRSNKMKAVIVAKMSVMADSKLSIDFASSEMRTFRTRPKTMIELLPPTIDPSKMLSKRSQPRP